MTGFFQGPDQAEREAELIRLVEVEGYSFAQIARIMGAPTRNTVLGRYNRMRKKAGHVTSPGKPKQLRPAVFDPKGNDRQVLKEIEGGVRRRHRKGGATVERPGTEPMTTEAGEPITIMEMNFKTMCNYPYGDPNDRDFRYCGHPVKEKSPYCETHHTACRMKPTPYKRKVDHAGKQR